MRRLKWLGVCVLLVDMAMVLSALVLSWLIWRWLHPVMDHIVQVHWTYLLFPNEWMPAGLGLIPIWILALRSVGFYQPTRMSTWILQLSAISRSVLIMLFSIVMLQFFLPQRLYSRSLIVLLLSLGFVCLSAWRFFLLRLQTVLPSPITATKVAIFGQGSSALLMKEKVQRHGSAFYEVVGYIAPSNPNRDPKVPEEEVLGSAEQLRDLVNEHDLETIILASRSLRRDDAMELARRCEHMGLRVLQVPFTWGIASPRVSLAALGDLQLIDLSTLSYPTLVQFFKRAFDLLAVSCGLLLLSPMLLATALMVRVDSPGPIFFTSPRAGKGGRAFPFFKFRSMIVGADNMKDALREQNESDGLLFKIKDDPRITRIGHFIRKYSIDEFPQFWNVIRGDMNLVGPRPLPMKDLQNIGDDPELAYWFELRHKVPPGITGLWQVSGRSNLGFDEMVELDIQYIQNWSFWLDIKILFLTIPAVLKGRGAA